MKRGSSFRGSVKWSLDDADPSATASQLPAVEERPDTAGSLVSGLSVDTSPPGTAAPGQQRKRLARSISAGDVLSVGRAKSGSESESTPGGKAVAGTRRSSSQGVVERVALDRSSPSNRAGSVSPKRDNRSPKRGGASPTGGGASPKRGTGGRSPTGDDGGRDGGGGGGRKSPTGNAGRRSPLSRSKSPVKGRLPKLITNMDSPGTAAAAAPAPPAKPKHVWELVTDEITQYQTTLTIQYLNPGCAFRVRVYSRNVHGWGPPSRPSARFRLPAAPRVSLATRTSLVVKWPQPFMDYLGPQRRSVVADIGGSGSDSEGEDYGLQHSLWAPPATTQYCYKVQYQVCLGDVLDGCMIWRPFHRCVVVPRLGWLLCAWWRGAAGVHGHAAHSVVMFVDMRRADT